MTIKKALLTGCSVISVAIGLASCDDQPVGELAEPETSPVRPNILFIVADDMGMADLGSFSSEIATPNLDRLAMEGVRFTDFHTATACSPTRAMLLTGVNSHKAGIGNMAEELAPNQTGQPGYEGYLNNRVITLATILRQHGYGTYMTGKWHLGKGEGKRPSDRGFERSFTMASGGASHYGDMRPAYAPSPDIKAPYQEDGVPLTSLPDSFEYSSQFYVDRLIDYLEADADKDKPFFAYLAYTAPHWPLQAPDEAIEAWRGHYNEGPASIHSTRLARQHQMGLVMQDNNPEAVAAIDQAWNALDEDGRAESVRAMEIYAAMISEMDRHTGRLISYLEASGKLDNTLIVFLSDNGPEGHTFEETWPKEHFPKIHQTILDGHDFSFDNMGKPNSYVFYGREWAEAGSPAYRLYKGFPTEGGTRVAAFAWAPGLIAGNRIERDFVSVKDITPTVLDMLDIDHPAREGIERPTGISQLENLVDADFTADERLHAYELMGKYMVRKGNWKLVHMPEPYGTGRWQLYDLATDPAETSDLAAAMPEKVAELSGAWEAYVVENNVILPDWVSGY